MAKSCFLGLKSSKKSKMWFWAQKKNRQNWRKNCTYTRSRVRIRGVGYGYQESGTDTRSRVLKKNPNPPWTKPSKVNVKGTLHQNLVLKGHFHKNQTDLAEIFFSRHKPLF